MKIANHHKEPEASEGAQASGAGRPSEIKGGGSRSERSEVGLQGGTVGSPQKKKILFYTDTPLLGGAEQQMLLLAQFLPKDQFEVMLACSAYPRLNFWCQKWIESGMRIFRLKVSHKHDPRHFWYLWKLLREEHIDLIHLHVWNPASCRYAFFASRLRKTPLIMTEHDPFPLPPMKDFLKKKFLSWGKTVIALSEENKRLLSMLYPKIREKIRVIPNGIDIASWQEKIHHAEQERDQVRKEVFEIPPEENAFTKVILCIAELNERKGQKYLIRAFQEIRQKMPQAKLVLVGEGPAKRTYEAYARAHGGGPILFLGYRRDIPALLASSDLFVLPSIREAFGLVLLEAALSKLPIVATDVGGIPEIIEHEKSGLLVKPKSWSSLASQILRLISDDTLAKFLAEHAERNVKEHFSAEKMASLTASVYHKVLP